MRTPFLIPLASSRWFAWLTNCLLQRETSVMHFMHEVHDAAPHPDWSCMKICLLLQLPRYDCISARGPARARVCRPKPRERTRARANFWPPRLVRLRWWTQARRFPLVEGKIHEVDCERPASVTNQSIPSIPSRGHHSPHSGQL